MEKTFEPEMAVCSHPALTNSIDALSAAGLNEIPAWVRPLGSLSNGERARVLLAARMGTGAVLDDFASNTDTHTACSTARALAAVVRRNGLRRVLIATVNRQWRDVFPSAFFVFSSVFPGRRPSSLFFRRPRRRSIGSTKTKSSVRL